MNLAEAVRGIPGYEHLDPTIDFIVTDNGKGLEITEWRTDLPKPSDDQLAQGWETHKAQEYQASRAAEYPSVGDQLDAILKHLESMGGYDGTDLDKIIGQWRAVKLEFPKGAQNG